MTTKTKPKTKKSNLMRSTVFESDHAFRDRLAKSRKWEPHLFEVIFILGGLNLDNFAAAYDVKRSCTHVAFDLPKNAILELANELRNAPLTSMIGTHVMLRKGSAVSMSVALDCFAQTLERDKGALMRLASLHRKILRDTANNAELRDSESVTLWTFELGEAIRKLKGQEHE